MLGRLAFCTVSQRILITILTDLVSCERVTVIVSTGVITVHTKGTFWAIER
jgi:hypothetical protein